MDLDSTLKNRSKSASRFPVSRIPSAFTRAPSAFHTRCVPAPREDKSVGPNNSPGKVPTKTELEEWDQVTTDKIWKQSVANERSGVVRWEENWGFLKDYDPKGNFKTREPLPEKVSVFSENAPNTGNQVIGHRLTKESGISMAYLQHRLNSGNRKVRNKDLILCD